MQILVNDDTIELEELRCVAVMPLGAPIDGTFF
mgnify:CR=1 FL=1